MMKQETANGVPLAVSIRVSGGYVPSPLPMHLDALLAYALTYEHTRMLSECGETPATLADYRALGEVLPLARHEQEGEWCWKSSALIPQGPIAHGTRNYTQRQDQMAFAVAVGSGRAIPDARRIGPTVRDANGVAVLTPPVLKRRQHNIEVLRGATRNLLGFYPVMQPQEKEDGNPFLELKAWCIGDPDKILRILESGVITHVGARRRSGHGRIESVSVREDPAAATLWQQRIRPWQMQPDDVPVMAAWRAPYWAAENRGAAFCPTSLV